MSLGDADAPRNHVRGSVSPVKKFALILPAAALVLAGCAHDPTIAARIAGQAISISDVTTLTNFICASSQTAAQQGTPQQAVPMTLVNERAMTLLAGARALEALAKQNNSSLPQQPSSNVGAALALVPAAQRQRAQQLVDEVNTAFTFLADKTRATQSNQVIDAFLAVIQSEAKEGKFTDNPAYPVMSSSTALKSESLSQAISSPATGSMTMAPTTGYVAGLPASQKCG